MKTILAILICISLTAAGATPDEPKGDTCRVYVVDVKAAQRFSEKPGYDAITGKPEKEQKTILETRGIGKVYDEFVTNVGEELLTTKTYPFPKGRQVITASVFYTDESMGSKNTLDSMIIAISVGAKPSKNAMDGRNAAMAEVTYNGGTDVVRVRKNLMVDGRQYVVAMECKCTRTDPKAKP